MRKPSSNCSHSPPIGRTRPAASKNPKRASTEKALFFAARSATSSMSADSLDHALGLLDQVVKMNGDLKWVARNEEAAIERQLGKNREAQALYDEVLKNDAKPAERREALCGKGDIFYEMGASGSKELSARDRVLRSTRGRTRRTGALAQPGGVQEGKSTREAKRQSPLP